MNGHKVHHGVVVAGVHNKSAIVAVPHRHIALGSEVRRRGVGEDLFARDEEPEGGLAGAEGLEVLSRDNFAGYGLGVSESGWSVRNQGCAYADAVAT